MPIDRIPPVLAAAEPAQRPWDRLPRAVSRNHEKKGSEGRAEDAGGLTPVKAGNAALRFLDR